METQRAALPTIGETDFERKVLRSPNPVLVHFAADWCAPCRTIEPAISALAADYGDRITVAKIDVDANPLLARRFGIRSLPTVVLLAGGVIRRVMIGARTAREYRAEIERVGALTGGAPPMQDSLCA